MMNVTNESNETSVENCGVPQVVFGVDEAIFYTQAALILLINILSFIFNFFAVFMIVFYKTLHSRTFMLALQILVFHIIASFVVLPPSFAVAVADRWLFGDIGCQILGFIHDAHLSIRYLFVLILTLDRFFTIFFPFFYYRYGNRIAVTMSAVTWVILLVRLLVPSYIFLNCIAYVPVLRVCTGIAGCSDACNIYFAVYLSVLVACTTFLPFVLNLILYCKSRRLYRETPLGDFSSTSENTDSNDNIDNNNNNNRNDEEREIGIGIESAVGSNRTTDLRPRPNNQRRTRTNALRNLLSPT